MNANDAENDTESMLIIQKLVKLQYRLTISATVSLISTLILVIANIIYEEEGELITFSLDSIIGFYVYMLHHKYMIHFIKKYVNHVLFYVIVALK